MTIPQLKVNVTHSGESTDYMPTPFASVQVKRRENNYDTAVLSFTDAKSQYYEDGFAKLDEIKIYLKDASESSWAQIFGGTIRDVIPMVNLQGFLPQLMCKGYGAALEETHCNRDYGLESANPELYKAQKIWQDLVDNFIKMSFASTNTGYEITKTKIADIASTKSIKYVNNPYRTNLEVVDIVCDLTSAIGAGSTPGAHWIVDNSKNLIINTIGAHENTEVWPDWWNTDEAGSTFEQGVDFENYTIGDKSEEFANKIVLITDFRRPAYDYWTDNNLALWGDDALAGLELEPNVKIVGADSLRIEFGIAQGEAYYPKNELAGWDITAWGSERTIPRLNFYFRANGDGTTAIGYLYLFTDDHNGASSYYIQFPDLTADKWYFHSIPIGPYWACAEEGKTYPWAKLGGGDWEHINGISFSGIKALGTPYFYVDDLHFSGKIARSAYNSWSILGNAVPPVTAKKEYQKVLISRNAMDDSCVAGDDTGFAGRIVYAELLRRQKKPKTIIFSTRRDMKATMAGQKLHIRTCKKSNGTFRIDTDMRIIELEIDLTVPSGLSYTVTATSDLFNSRPISLPDRYAMWQENMFINSAEAKNIRSGAEVDLLIPLLEKDYPSDDD